MRGEDAGQVVRDRHPDAHRRAIRVTGELEQAAVPDAHAVEAGPGRVRAVLPERADADDDERRVEIRGADVPLLERAGPEVLDDDVRSRGQPSEEVLPFVAPEVEGDALAPASLYCPEERVALASVGLHERADLAHEVAAPRLLDLDDLCAHLAEQSGAERRRDARAQVEDAQALERPAHDTVRI